MCQEERTDTASASVRYPPSQPNTVVSTPASQRSYSSTTPSSTVWASSPNTLYSPIASKQLSEPDELGLDSKLNHALGLGFKLREPPAMEDVGRWLMVCKPGRAVLAHQQLTNVPTTADGAQIQSLIKVCPVLTTILTSQRT